ncbi:hypothetical protein A6F65_00687 [Paraurantiacibacter namhicola]|uniref:Uncharacterized protein n=1 Tax=Paraurantiacibacter namhicola TaxID=645517 RepID=A0A1C7D6B7_9SPHN|nr:hypothetical protein A6F65_00687 [Paraurantiacibacter namhicola]
MAYYYVNRNAQTNGDHEVHRVGCNFMPKPENRQYVGDHMTCGPAVREAKRFYAKANGCYYCSNACHTT